MTRIESPITSKQVGCLISLLKNKDVPEYSRRFILKYLARNNKTCAGARKVIWYALQAKNGTVVRDSSLKTNSFQDMAFGD